MADAKMNEDSDDYVFQQDGCPDHFHNEVRDYLNTNLPERWIGRRSPDLRLCDFSLWGFVKDTVFVPPVPVNLQVLGDRITAAVALIDSDMLTRVWNELYYRLDVCHISHGGHIEHL